MKNKSILKYVIYSIIGLAAFGVVIQLFTNTTGFLKNIFITLLFALAIFGLLYYFVLGGRSSSNSDTKKYKQAVRQSKSKYATEYHSGKLKTQHHASPIKKKVKKRPNHLRVIDGNKSKRKKRASN